MESNCIEDFKNLCSSYHFPITVINTLHDIILNFGIERMILFGSRAQGDNRNKSDFDIAIEFQNNKNYKFFKVKDYVDNNNTLYYISLVDLNNCPIKLEYIIKKTGIIIYE